MRFIWLQNPLLKRLNTFWYKLFSAPRKVAENEFIPLTWKEKRMLNYWQNCEPDFPKDENVIRGQFNLKLYLQYRNTIQN